MILRYGYKNLLLIFGLFITVLFFVLPASFLDWCYGGLIYPLVRLLLHLVSWIPIPLIYIVLMAMPGWIYYVVKSKKGWRALAIQHLKFFFIIIILFYWLWAFNYSRISFASRFEIKVPRLDSSALTVELLYAMDLMNIERPQQLFDATPGKIEEMIRPSVKSICNAFGYQTPGKIRVKALYPKGSLLRIKTAGFYFPHAGEAYMDPGLHPLQWAFTMAHEMCHGYGVTDEGACNFLAFLATQHHPDSNIQYSGAIGYFRYVAGTYRYYYPEAYQLIRSQLSPAIRSDLDQINVALRRYPDLFPKLRDQIYDNYLKLQGVKEGMASYDQIIDLVRQAKAQGLLVLNSQAKQDSIKLE